jgi:hypothetical protein
MFRKRAPVGSGWPTFFTSHGMNLMHRDTHGSGVTSEPRQTRRVPVERVYADVCLLRFNGAR